jgi:hypothetical protein
VLAGASAVVDFGTLPSTGGAGEITLGVLIDVVRLEVSYADWLAQDAAHSSGGALEGAHIQLLDASGRVCFRARPVARLEVDPCLGGAFVFAASDGFGPAGAFEPFQRSGTWGALEADLLASWRLFGPLALRGAFGLRAPLTRPSFTIDSPGGEVFLHRPAAGEGRVSLGLEVIFP